ncbi:MAG: phosphocholine cytidylyltransferase family protein [Bacteroidota bacterium]
MIKTAVILAAGRGMRLRPYTYEIPKGFMKVGEETLIERSIRILQSNGISNIIIGTGHLHEQYEKLAEEKGFKTYVSSNFATTGSFHTLYNGKDLISEDFLLLESDLLYEERAIDSLLSSDKKDVILCSGFTKSQDEVYVEIANGLLKNLSKKREMLNSIDAELVGIWKISQTLFYSLCKHHETAPDALSKDYEVAIANLSNEHKVFASVIEDLVWCEIDNEEHLQRAKSKIFPRLD